MRKISLLSAESAVKSAAKCLLAAPLLSVGTTALAETPGEKGHSIFAEADKRNQGFVDSAGTLLMVLKDKKGETSEREMRVKALEGPESEGDKTLKIGRA